MLFLKINAAKDILLNRKCATCSKEEKLQRKQNNNLETESGIGLENYVTGLNGSGNNLTSETNQFFSERIGHDFSNVKIHTDQPAARSAQGINALAYTTDNHIVFNQNQFNPETENGKKLLAHELTHVVQQNGNISTKKIQRFTKAEKNQIGTLNQILKNAKVLVEDASTYEEFVEMTGGQSVYANFDTTKKSNADSKETTQLNPRYLITCQCGMIDMRHFYQLMYIATKMTNAYATKKGREHELNAEPKSRFSAEDTTSNALGAYFGSELPLFFVTADRFAESLKELLNRCRPGNFRNLPVDEQQGIIEYYDERDATTGIPVNQSETASPAILDISECEKYSRSFPYKKDSSDKKTITGLRKPYSFTDDNEIRDWVNAQSELTIEKIPPQEKSRLISILKSVWESNDDTAVIKKLKGSS
ncbi:MAG: DUF4157 domain-containing protein [Fimbriimonadaceae bacterium]|nr:DUF4157 domain-containing protein [Chitinophagales bacterium]